MNLRTALDIVVSRTGHERFRQLCDPGHPAYDPAYVPYVMARAAEPSPAPAPSPAPPRPARPASTSIPLAGDLVAALTARIGADRAAEWVAKKLGKPCGCSERRARLNRLDQAVRKFLGI